MEDKVLTLINDMKDSWVEELKLLETEREGLTEYVIRLVIEEKQKVLKKCIEDTMWLHYNVRQIGRGEIRER